MHFSFLFYYRLIRHCCAILHNLDVSLKKPKSSRNNPKTARYPQLAWSSNKYAMSSSSVPLGLLVVSTVSPGPCVVPVRTRSVVSIVVLIEWLLLLRVARRPGTPSLLVALIHLLRRVRFDAVAGRRRTGPRERLEMGRHRNGGRRARHKALVGECLTWNLLGRSVQLRVLKCNDDIKKCITQSIFKVTYP